MGMLFFVEKKNSFSLFGSKKKKNLKVRILISKSEDF